MSTTYDLTCLVPVLEAGAEIPGFHKLGGHWAWHPIAYLSSTVSVRDAPPEAYYAAIGWLTEQLLGNGGRCYLHDMYDGQHAVYDQQDEDGGFDGPWHDTMLEALCDAWLKEAGK